MVKNKKSLIKKPKKHIINNINININIKNISKYMYLNK